MNLKRSNKYKLSITFLIKFCLDCTYIYLPSDPCTLRMEKGNNLRFSQFYYYRLNKIIIPLEKYIPERESFGSIISPKGAFFHESQSPFP